MKLQDCLKLNEKIKWVNDHLAILTYQDIQDLKASTLAEPNLGPKTKGFECILRIEQHLAQFIQPPELSSTSDPVLDAKAVLEEMSHGPSNQQVPKTPVSKTGP